MTKQLLLLFTVAICFSSFTTEPVYTVDKLLNVVDAQVGKEVKITGTVTHVCKHSGKKCFIVGDDGKTTIQIMAGGDITAFGQDLVGSDIEALGIVKEHRVAKDAIDTNEKTAHDKMHSGEGSHEQCQAMLDNVKTMREWMEKNNKDYFAIYYIDGTKYEVVD